LRTWWLYPSSLRSSLPSRTGSHNGLFRETSHVVKSRRQRSIIERTQRPFSFDNKAPITKDLDPPALLRRPRFGSKEGAVRHESVGSAHSSLLAFNSSQWRWAASLLVDSDQCGPLRPGDTRKYRAGHGQKPREEGCRDYPLKLGPELGFVGAARVVELYGVRRFFAPALLRLEQPSMK
jgi:hypothetical protein